MNEYQLHFALACLILTFIQAVFMIHVLKPDGRVIRDYLGFQAILEYANNKGFEEYRHCYTTVFRRYYRLWFFISVFFIATDLLCFYYMSEFSLMIMITATMLVGLFLFFHLIETKEKQLSYSFKYGSGHSASFIMNSAMCREILETYLTTKTEHQLLRAFKFHLTSSRSQKNV